MTNHPTARVLVALATYNERESLARLVKAIHHYLSHADVLIIDDGSPDGTGDVADELAREYSWVRVIHRACKSGLGTALLLAMRCAMEGGYQHLVTMDADGSHAPDYLPALLDGMQTNDVMIGSRYVQGGGTRHWPRSRRWMSLAVNALVRILMRLPARDCSSGYRCYGVDKLREAQLDRMLSHGYSFEEEVLYRVWKTGCRIGEYPILFENRREGASKVNMAEALRSLGILCYLGGRARLGLKC